MIKAAAVQFNEKVVFTGVRHCEIFDDLKRLRYEPPYHENYGFIQGFLTDSNEFLSRSEALDHAVECGQIGFTESGKYNIIGSVLTSEDLW